MASRKTFGVLAACRSQRKYYSTNVQLSNSDVIRKRTELFQREKERQLALISRIEKIQVEHKGPPENCSLLMNKKLSTPFNCAMHIQELLMERSVMALVNGQPWDMHRPLVEDCELQFLHFKDEDPALCNEAYWRTGSFILGYILERAFKDNFYVELCSFPAPNVPSGSFVYDVDLKTTDWKPSSAEKNCLSRIGAQLGYADNRFEPLTVDATVAAKMFEDNRFKSAQIPNMAAKSSTGNTVTVYRMGDHVDITRGPLIASTQQIMRFNVTAIHDIDSPDFGPMKRVQGLSTPKQLPMHYWAYELLCDRASEFNGSSPTPRLYKSRELMFQNLLNNA